MARTAAAAAASGAFPARTAACPACLAACKRHVQQLLLTGVGRAAAGTTAATKNATGRLGPRQLGVSSAASCPSACKIRCCRRSRGPHRLRVWQGQRQASCGVQRSRQHRAGPQPAVAAGPGRPPAAAQPPLQPAPRGCQARAWLFSARGGGACRGGQGWCCLLSGGRGGQRRQPCRDRVPVGWRLWRRLLIVGEMFVLSPYGYGWGNTCSNWAILNISPSPPCAPPAAAADDGRIRSVIASLIALPDAPFGPTRRAIASGHCLQSLPLGPPEQAPAAAAAL